MYDDEVEVPDESYAIPFGQANVTREGDAMTYRGTDEVAKLRATKDPLNIFRQRVVEAALLKPEDLDRIDQEIKSHIDQVTVEAKAAAMPTEKDLLTDVYVSY